MGNRTFIIMLAACLLQILVVAGTVTYVAVRDSGAASTPAADAATSDELQQQIGAESADTETGNSSGYGY
jgi:hypothetical protein